MACLAKGSRCSHRCARTERMLNKCGKREPGRCPGGLLRTICGGAHLHFVKSDSAEGIAAKNTDDTKPRPEISRIEPRKVRKFRLPSQRDRVAASHDLAGSTGKHCSVFTRCPGGWKAQPRRRSPGRSLGSVKGAYSFVPPCTQATAGWAFLHEGHAATCGSNTQLPPFCSAFPPLVSRVRPLRLRFRRSMPFRSCRSPVSASFRHQPAQFGRSAARLREQGTQVLQHRQDLPVGLPGGIDDKEAAAVHPHA